MNYLDKPKLARLTSEIHFFNEQGIKVSIEVGKRLEEAKSEFLNADEWMQWAESEFGYKKSQAYKLVAIAKRFHSSGISLEGKTINELYALTAFDDSEITEPAQLSNGETKKPIDMTQKEIEQYKREKAEAERRAQEAEARARQAEQDARHWQGVAKSQPVRIETKTVEVLPPDYNDLKEQAIMAQRLNTENVQLKRSLNEQREQYEQRLTQEDKRRAVNKDLKKFCQELLQNQGMYTEAILYNLSLNLGDRESAQIIEAFQIQYNHDVQVFMTKIKQMTTVRTVS